jgi:hypothetical protein
VLALVDATRNEGVSGSNPLVGFEKSPHSESARCATRRARLGARALVGVALAFHPQRERSTASERCADFGADDHQVRGLECMNPFAVAAGDSPI